MFYERLLERHEIPAIWSIDRREVITAIYTLVDGELTLQPAHFDMQGWPPGEAELYTPILESCYDRGGWFYGVFDAAQLVGVAVLDSRLIGAAHDQLQLKFLHVGYAYRGQGLGRKLFGLAANEARRRGAQHMYISATPSAHTITFYLRLGCRVTATPDPELFALEPDDIHFTINVLLEHGMSKG
jgi:predicted N-acetyltransferase YhbS